MAFLVAYKRKDENLDWTDKALYLNQEFYSEIFHVAKEESSDSILSQVARLGYGEELHLESNQLEKLQLELEHIEDKQSKDFSILLTKVLNEGLDLAISGDMCSVLK